MQTVCDVAEICRANVKNYLCISERCIKYAEIVVSAYFVGILSFMVWKVSGSDGFLVERILFVIISGVSVVAFRRSLFIVLMCFIDRSGRMEVLNLNSDKSDQ